MATITVSEFAEVIETDARTARKFLRTITPADAHPGKGSRWSIEKRDIRSLKSKFVKYQAEMQEAKSQDITPDDEELHPLELPIEDVTDEE